MCKIRCFISPSGCKRILSKQVHFSGQACTTLKLSNCTLIWMKPNFNKYRRGWSFHKSKKSTILRICAQSYKSLPKSPSKVENVWETLGVILYISIDFTWLVVAHTTKNSKFKKSCFSSIFDYLKLYDHLKVVIQLWNYFSKKWL